MIWPALVVLFSVMAWEFSKLWKAIDVLVGDMHKLRNDVFAQHLKTKLALKQQQPQDVA